MLEVEAEEPKAVVEHHQVDQEAEAKVQVTTNNLKLEQLTLAAEVAAEAVTLTMVSDQTEEKVLLF